MCARLLEPDSGKGDCNGEETPLARLVKRTVTDAKDGRCSYTKVVAVFIDELHAELARARRLAGVGG